MRLYNVTNKYEIFQAYYEEMYGEEISYSEALDLYARMDAGTKADFEQFYKDETGYQIIPVAGGLFLDSKGSTDVNQAYINVKYTIEAYAKQNGIILDPVWGQYSYEEIISMVENGVNIPQDVVDLAYTMAEKDPNTAEDETAASDNDGQENIEPQDTYLDLLPKAVKKIELCERTNEKIDDKIEDLLPIKERNEDNFLKKVEEQFEILEDLSDYYREWNQLQTKINKGEPLSDSEAEKYALLTGMLDDRNKDAQSLSDFGIDKREIARNLSDLNILSVLGEELAAQTIELGEELSDYVSEKNYASTNAQVSGAIGFVASIMAMALGERISEEAIDMGQFTKDYTHEATTSVNEIATSLDIKSSVISSNEIQELRPQGAEFNPDTATNEITEAKEAKEEGTSPEVSKEEDFIINDNNVKGLMKEALDIDGELAKQVFTALKGIKVSRENKKFAKIAGFKVTMLVERFKAEEEARQKRTEELQAQNEQEYNELEELTGKSKGDLQAEIEGKEEQQDGSTSGAETSENNAEEAGQQQNNSMYGVDIPKNNSEEVQQHKNTIKANNGEIETIKAEEAQAVEIFKVRTNKEKTAIEEKVPAENEAIEANNEFVDKILPEHEERLDFAHSSGKTLKRMGKFRIKVGFQQIAALQIKKGVKNIAKGTVSASIGFTTEIVSDTPLPKLSEKATKGAIKEETASIDELNSVDQEIVGITGEDSTQQNYESQQSQETENGEESQTAEQTSETSDSEAQGGENTTTSAQTTGEDLTTAQPIKNAVANTLTTSQTKSVKENNSAQNVAQPVATQNNAEGLAVASTAVSTTTSSSSTNNSTKEDETSDQAIEAQGENAEKIEKQQDKACDKAGDDAKETTKSAKDDAKESKKIDKDEKKDAKQLEKEAKQLQKQIKKEEDEAIKLTEESQEAVNKQNEILIEYEAKVAENEKLVMEDEQNNQAQAILQPSQEQGSQEASVGVTSNNTSIMMANDQRINELNAEFTIHSRTVTTNRGKIQLLNESIKTKSAKYTKKVKIKEKQVKETTKKENEKQKKLQKQLAAIGIVENIFSITSAIGLILDVTGKPMIPAGNIQTTAGKALIAAGTSLLSNPFTAAAGAAMVASGTALEVSGDIQIATGTTLTTVGSIMSEVGRYGSLACGVAKAGINIANGNLAAGLMSLGMAAVSAVTGGSGVGGAASKALTYTAQGLNIVASSASLGNNVRQVQGKESNNVLSKISTVAGVASAVTNAAASFSNFKSGNVLQKIATIGNATSTAMTSTSQLMTEFGADGKAAQMLGAVGGAIGMASSLSSAIGSKVQANKAEKNNMDAKNADTKAENVNKANEETSNGDDGKGAKSDEAKTKEDVSKDIANSPNPNPAAISDAKANTSETKQQVKAEIKKIDTEVQQAETDIAEMNAKNVAAQEFAQKQQAEEQVQPQQPNKKDPVQESFGKIKEETDAQILAEAKSDAPQQEFAGDTPTTEDKFNKWVETKLQAEMDKMKNSIKPPTKKQKFDYKKGLEMLGKGMEVATNVMGFMASNKEAEAPTQKKKEPPAFKKTKRLRDIQKKRVTALQAARRAYLRKVV